MSDGYVKLFQSILNSSLMHLDSDTFKVFIVMLAMADPDGIVRASVLAISDRSKVDLRTTERALNVFMEPDPYSTNPDNEGRRVARVQEGWFILNHSAYRERKPRSQQLTAARVQRHRDKKKAEQAQASETPVMILNELQQAATLCNALKRQDTAETPEAEAEEEADREEEAEAESEGSASAFSSALRSSISEGDSYRTALWKRLMRVVMHRPAEEPEGRDPPHYRDWWRKVSKRVVDADGIGELEAWVTYCEDCRDPAKRAAKGLGNLDFPAKWMGKKARDFLSLKGLKLPKAPENAQMVGK